MSLVTFWKDTVKADIVVAVEGAAEGMQKVPFVCSFLKQCTMVEGDGNNERYLPFTDP